MSSAALAQETPPRTDLSERRIALGLLLSAYMLSATTLRTSNVVTQQGTNGFNTSLLATAELQLACSSAAVYPAGEFIGPDKLEDDICDVPMTIEDGAAILPQGAGLGVEINREKLKAYATTPEEASAALS